MLARGTPVGNHWSRA